jgi:hypothetical protein
MQVTTATRRAGMRLSGAAGAGVRAGAASGASVGSGALGPNGAQLKEGGSDTRQAAARSGSAAGGGAGRANDGGAISR